MENLLRGGVYRVVGGIGRYSSVVPIEEHNTQKLVNERWANESKRADVRLQSVLFTMSNTTCVSRVFKKTGVDMDARRMYVVSDA